MKLPRFSKSAARSGPGFRTTVARHYRLRWGRFQLALEVTTKDALEIDRRTDAYRLLKRQALASVPEEDVWVVQDELGQLFACHVEPFGPAEIYLHAVIETGNARPARTPA